VGKKKIPAQIENYLRFAQKHKAHFGFKSKAQIYFDRGILFQLRATYGHLKKGNYKSAHLSMAHCLAYLKRWTALKLGLETTG
jgi:hypothetical protein